MRAVPGPWRFKSALVGVLFICACHHTPARSTWNPRPDLGVVPVAIVGWPRPSCEFPPALPEPPEVKVYVPPSGLGAPGLERIYITMRNLEDVLEYNKKIRIEGAAVRRCLAQVVKIIELSGDEE